QNAPGWPNPLPPGGKPLQSFKVAALRHLSPIVTLPTFIVSMEMNMSAKFPRIAGLGLVLGLIVSAGAAHSKSIEVKTGETPVRVITVTDGLANPWGLTFLPDGRMLVTERVGTMRIVSADGKKGPALAGLPDIVSRGQGGLLDVVLAPDFATSKRIYFSYSEPAEEGKGNSTAVSHAVLAGDKLEQVTRI